MDKIKNWFKEKIKEAQRKTIVGLKKLSILLSIVATVSALMTTFSTLLVGHSTLYFVGLMNGMVIISSLFSYIIFKKKEIQ